MTRRPALSILFALLVGSFVLHFLQPPLFAGHVRAVALREADAPVTLSTAWRVNEPPTVAFNATNTSSKRVSGYTVFVFWFPHGPRSGFVIQEPRLPAALERREGRAAVMTLPPGVTLDSKSTLIIAVDSVRFDDGTEWRSSGGGAHARVDQKARALKLK